MRVRVFETDDPNSEPSALLGTVLDVDLGQQGSSREQVLRVLRTQFPALRLFAFNSQDQELPGWEEVTVANAAKLPAFLASRKQLKAVRGGSLQVSSSEGLSADTTLQLLQTIMSDRDQQPLTYADLPDELPLLSQPLPVSDWHLQRLACSSLAAQSQLPALAVSVTQQPAGGDTHDPSGATDSKKRPDARFFLSSILMFKGECKVGAGEFDLAVEGLHSKAAQWTPAFHGSREYLICFAAAAHRLRFYAVKRGGTSHKPISVEFDLNKPLDRVQVMHTTIRALTIVLQQWRNHLPAKSLPLNLIEEHGHSKISYRADHVLKLVNWAHFQNADLATLTHVYDTLLAIPCGAGLQHPRGLIRPLSWPMLLDDGIWRVKMPLGLPLSKASLPVNLSRLRSLIIDVLHGLAELHARKIVHRDIRKQNILEMHGGAFVLIDYEHSGLAGAVPPFEPLYHYPPECQGRNRPFSTAADMYSVGYLMEDAGIDLDSKARALHQQLTAHIPAQRPSARSALSHPWLAET